MTPAGGVETARSNRSRRSGGPDGRRLDGSGRGDGGQWRGARLERSRRSGLDRDCSGRLTASPWPWLPSSAWADGQTERLSCHP